MRLRGTSKIEGMVTGRRLDFRFHSFRDGQGWFDIAADGKSFVGANNADGFPGWSGWKGRLAPEFQRHVSLVAGKIVDGSTKNLLTYTVRAPEGYDAGSSQKWPTVLILHGSNMNSRSYVSTIAAAWPDIARDFIVLGINGEMPSALGDDPRFNYSYINYVGRSTYKGFPGTDRESPALVNDAMAELKEVYPISHYLVGGHSQGGFLTYSLLMNFPESMAGAFPISCGVIFQCEPDAYSDESLRKGQRVCPWRSSTVRTIRLWDLAWASTRRPSSASPTGPPFIFFPMKPEAICLPGSRLVRPSAGLNPIHQTTRLA